MQPAWSGFSVTNANVADFKNLSINSATNWSGAQAGNYLQDTTNLAVTTAFGLAGGTHTLTVVISENFWVAPANAPLLMSTSGGGSIGVISGSNTLAAGDIGYVDNSNVLATSMTPGGAATPDSTGGKSLPPGTTGNYTLSPSPATAVAPAMRFTMTEVFNLTFTVGANSVAASGGISDTFTVTPVPAPAGALLALAGLPCLGIGAWLRRRQAA